MKKLLITLMVLTGMVCSATATERTILLGPKTIGRGWKDKIVILPEQFKNVSEGDIMTLYTEPMRGSAQAAYQSPKDWQPIAPGYAYFSVKGPVRTTLTASMLANLKEYGLGIAGHDFVIVRVTIMPASDMQETIIYKGPSVQMRDWSVNADIQRDVFQGLRLGDDVRFYVSNVKDGAAIKLADTQWAAFDASVDGAQVAGDYFTWSINDQMQLVKLQLAGPDGVVMHVGGKGYQLDRISVVRCVAEPDPDVSTAQRAPKEYKLRSGELFRGEMEFPNDFSTNLRITAEPFQEITADYAIVVYYRVLPGAAEAGIQPKLSFRENKGDWYDLTGAHDPVWYDLNGRNMILHIDDVMLDKLKTRGFVLTGQGFVLTKMLIINEKPQ